MSLNKDDVIECPIESLAFGGRGVAHVDGMALFVEGGLPGDTVTARVVRAKKRFAEAVVETVVTPSLHRVDPRCPHFGQCGGCVLQDLEYAEQLSQKAAQVESALKRIGGVDSLTLDPPAGSPAQWNYRNKMEFAFERRDGSLHLGLRSVQPAGQKGLAPVLDIEECHLCAGRDMEIMRMVREYCRESGVAAYDAKTDNGFWRHLIIRHTALGELMVHVITTADKRKFKQVEGLGAALVDRFPELTSFIHSSRAKRSIVAAGEFVEFRLGTKTVEEMVTHDGREARYHISPNAFFQTNSAGAGELFGTVADFGGFTGSETLLDLYCGIGAIGLFLADRVKRVIGYEISEEAVAKAWSSAKLNDVSNCDFVAGTLDAVDNLKSLPKADVLVIDPPRSGMHENTALALLKLAPPKIIAVSCDPATLARDVKRLSEKYELKRARAVDMFPHTHHIETVALLELK
ncbi:MULTISPECIES: 23S rRNA (uracil(1939)-C(5))-methyltransferase RlmD [unclassified Pseudodesulfovibrio]|uniref:23S rRNA (uracil(1939)-C(5))-methyltransferase RlmD n=1 Tax=unclassified Pseudodesulfovibrio TaxID=2661612 RepID=UPI000FEBF79E|nr:MULTISPECIES: 23S rRNA (uracil(1939)-C(5))-methyltransferase RlmD [unclassified Pseudodesulfovibrio]MCJ2164886.1 23S rRNA (uracil(1939)-C(5))-methyltransferase RlmD [Pseudodesulfovibrio sp. S3-i]RWU03747.1 23S rRNA (uracil(1939)-C(5))-methyltransferase RlmD [Pseudodesulfovibrio sp. S3]